MAHEYRDDHGLAARLRECQDTFGSDHPLTRAAFDARAEEVAQQAAAAPEPGLWWLSFVDDGFRGVCIVETISMVHAVQLCWELGINPGGEVAGWGPFPSDKVALKWRNRLLSKEDVEAYEEEMGIEDG